MAVATTSTFPSDEHFHKAAEGDCSALQKALQELAGSGQNERGEKSENPVKHDLYRVLTPSPVGAEGFEPPTYSV